MLICLLCWPVMTPRAWRTHRKTKTVWLLPKPTFNWVAIVNYHQTHILEKWRDFGLSSVRERLLAGHFLNSFPSSLDDLYLIVCSYTNPTRLFFWLVERTETKSMPSEYTEYLLGLKITWIVYLTWWRLLLVVSIGYWFLNQIHDDIFSEEIYQSSPSMMVF